MRQDHELSPAWRGAPWVKRAVRDWSDMPVTEGETPRVWLPLALSVALGVALGATVVAGLARQDRMRFDTLMAAARASR